MVEHGNLLADKQSKEIAVSACPEAVTVRFTQVAFTGSRFRKRGVWVSLCVIVSALLFRCDGRSGTASEDGFYLIRKMKRTSPIFPLSASAATFRKMSL
jgi:hypothetical protein